MKFTKELKLEFEGLEKVVHLEIEIDDEKYLYELFKINFFDKYSAKEFVEMFDSWLATVNTKTQELFNECVSDCRFITWKELVKEMAMDDDLINAVTELCNEINPNYKPKNYFNVEIMAQLLENLDNGIDL